MIHHIDEGIACITDGGIYEPPFLARRRTYLKHRSWVLPVFVVLAVLVVIGCGLAALSGVTL